MTEAKAPPEVITLLDGRTREFAGKKRLHKESVTTPEGALQVRLDFRNGETRLFTIRPDMLAKFALHGAEQKLGDEISSIEGIDDAVEAIDQLMQRLDAGEWTKEREGGTGMAGASILTKAMVEFSQLPIDKVREYLLTLDNKTKMALRKSAELAPIVERLEAEAAARAAARGAGKPTVDVGAVLAGLKAGPATSAFTQ